MDAAHFDRIVKSLFTAASRRGLLGLLAAIPVVGGLTALLAPDESAAKKRRQRRKKRSVGGENHKHGHRRRKHKPHHSRQKHKKKHKKACQPEPKATTCASRCGTVQNNCKKPVDCGPCKCDPPCGTCETCTSELVCEACDPCCDDVCCAQATAICHAFTGACCEPDSPAQTCNNRCGDIINNCGITVDCGPCTCGDGCPECRICAEESGDCVPDLQQEGDDCGEEGQVCQSDGSCACDADSCPACTTCENDGFCTGCAECCDDGQCVGNCGDCQVCDDGQCAPCPDCCDAQGVCQPGTSDAACGSSGACDICTAQEECQNQECVCVPDCEDKVCGPDGCNGTCDPGCPPLSTCSIDGTNCDCDFAPCDDICCAEGESCCGSDCVDLDTDSAHCGNCATACAGGEVCQAGECGGVCGAGFCEASSPAPDCCGTTCVDLQTNDDHCGNCATSCPDGQDCQGGECGIVCDGDFCPVATHICDAGTCQPCDICAEDGCFATIQAAITATGSGGTIRICAGTYTRGGTNPVADVNKSLTLIGAGAGSTILTGGNIATSNPVLFSSQAATTTNLRQLTITGGNGASGIQTNPLANVTLANVTVAGNTGAGILNNTASVTLNAEATVTGNSAGSNGGGIHTTNGGVTLNAGSSVTGNSAGADGGGIYNLFGTVTLNDGSLVSDNDAGDQGGGIHSLNGTVKLHDGSRVSDNDADTDGGGIFANGGTVTLDAGSLVCGNDPNQCVGFGDSNGVCQDICPA